MRGGARYGYLWWINEFAYRDRKVDTFVASGNGGQIILGFRELDLVIAFWGGNYADPAGFDWLRKYVPAILPAVLPQ